MDEPLALPSPCLVVLVGPSGSGKTTWAEAHFPGSGVVSSDALRAVVGAGDDDLTASDDAFALLDTIEAQRMRRRLTTVVDTTGLEPARRRVWIELARRHDVTPVAVAFDVTVAECRARNRARARAVPERVIAGQRRAFTEQRGGLLGEGFERVVEPVAVRLAPRHIVAAATMRDAATLESPAVDAPAAPGALRFGLQIPVTTWPGGPAELGARLATIAAAAEDAGFESIWLMDHLRQIPLFGPAWLDMLDAWTTLGYLAAATSRVRLGPMVSPVTLRSVPLIAKIVATLDVLSGGRAVCGLGLGWFVDEHRALGLPFPPVAERYARLEDALQALPLLWGPGTPPFEGRTMHLPEALCYPRPIQARVPILVGGGGERRTLALVARYADACNIVGEAPVVRRKVAALHAHCTAFGRDPASVEVTQLSTTIVGYDAAEVAGLVERTRPRRTAAERWAARTNAGTVGDQVGRYRELAEAGVGTAIVSLPDLDGTPAAVERFAPVIAAFS